MKIGESKNEMKPYMRCNKQYQMTHGVINMHDKLPRDKQHLYTVVKHITDRSRPL